MSTHKALQAHHKALSQTTLAALFESDLERISRFSLENDGIFVDYSRNLVDEKALDLLFQWLRESDFEARREALLAGALRYDDLPDPILHTVLRGGVHVNKVVRSGVESAQEKFLGLAERLYCGDYLGATGKPVRDVVNLGIGGGHLGALLACDVLGGDPGGLNKLGGRGAVKAHCVVSADGVRLKQLTERLDPETTLFVVSSRSFKTRETLMSAAAARKWLEAAVGDEQWSRHMVAATSDIAAAVQFGLPEEQCLLIPAGVGGRMSLWSAAGLAPAAAVGRSEFGDLLRGAATMDEHFATEPMERNLPVILALLGAWHSDIGGCASQAVLTYDYRLSVLSAYLQQLQMESNGKSAGCDGKPVPSSSPVVWGGSGMDGQHAYFQMLHQGTWPVACEFILTAAEEDDDEMGDFARANCIAQARALMEGCEHKDPERASPGNRSSTTIMLRRLDAYQLGMLIALYEHKVFTQAALWGINPFSQWGVELGKRLADDVAPALSGEAGDEGLDAAMRALVKRCRSWRGA